MAARRDVANAGTYQMGRPVNQRGGSARNRPVRNAGTAALSRLAIGSRASTADPYGRPTSGAGFGRGNARPTYNYGDELGFNIQPASPADPLGRPTEGVGFGRGDGRAPSSTADPYGRPTDGLGFGRGDGGSSASTGISSSVGGGSTGSAAPAAETAAGPTDAIAALVGQPRVNPLDALYSTLFERLGAQRDQRSAFWDTQDADLTSRVDNARTMQSQAMDNARSVLANGVNPYAAMQVAQSQTAGNPFAEFMSATGVDPSQVDQLVSLNSANNQQYDAAARQALDTLGAAYTGANQSQLNDLALIGAGFQNDLSAQENALRAMMTSGRASDTAAFDQRDFDARQAQIGDNQSWDTNNENTRQTLFQNILSSYGDSLDPQSLVDLVTAFATATGQRPQDLMPTGMSA